MLPICSVLHGKSSTGAGGDRGRSVIFVRPSCSFPSASRRGLLNLLLVLLSGTLAADRQQHFPSDQQRPYEASCLSQAGHHWRCFSSARPSDRQRCTDHADTKKAPDDAGAFESIRLSRDQYLMAGPP